MKHTLTRLSLLLLAVALLLPLAACKPTEPEPQEKEVWLCYSRQVYGVEPYQEFDYYDEYGNRIKNERKYPNGKVTVWLYEYDQNHNLIRRSVDTGKGEPFVQLICTYDENGRLVEERNINAQGESVYTYQYDQQGRRLSRSYKDEVVEVYTYEADGSYRVGKPGNTTIYALYNADGRVLERHNDSATKALYTYNDAGILLEEVTYNGETVNTRTKYYLDEHGNAIKVTRQPGEGEETVSSESEYRLYTVKVK